MTDSLGEAICAGNNKGHTAYVHRYLRYFFHFLGAPPPRRPIGVRDGLPSLSPLEHTRRKNSTSHININPPASYLLAPAVFARVSCTPKTKNVEPDINVFARKTHLHSVGRRPGGTYSNKHRTLQLKQEYCSIGLRRVLPIWVVLGLPSKSLTSC